MTEDWIALKDNEFEVGLHLAKNGNTKLEIPYCIYPREAETDFIIY